MMVPKMVRPPAKSVATLSPAAAPAPVAPAPVTRVLAQAATAKLPGQLTPSFTLHSAEDQFVARYWSQIVLAAIAIVALGCLIWGLSGPSPPARSAMSSTVNTANWSHQPALPAERSLTLYEPSRGEPDYRMEFSWVPDAAGVGWVFRTRDANNYYAAHLSLQQRGAAGVLMAEHFSVLAGAESAHSRKVIPLENAASLVKVQMVAAGSAFKLLLNDHPADSWTDARLNTGVFGFYDDGGRPPKVLALSLTFTGNAVSRTAMVQLP